MRIMGVWHFRWRPVDRQRAQFRGWESHPYELYFPHDIEHRRTRVSYPQTNGFVERFQRTVLDEFFHVAFRIKLYELLEALQADLDAWLYTTTPNGHTKAIATWAVGPSKPPTYT